MSNEETLTTGVPSGSNNVPLEPSEPPLGSLYVTPSSPSTIAIGSSNPYSANSSPTLLSMTLPNHSFGLRSVTLPIVIPSRT